MKQQSGIPYIIQHQRLNTAPNGTSLAAIINVPEGNDFEPARNAIDIVRHIHGDGRLPPISIKEWRFADHPAALEYDQNLDGTTRPREIRVSFGLEYSTYNIIHEIGHLLDWAIGQDMYSSQSNHPLLLEWREAVENTLTIQRLRALNQQETMLWQGKVTKIDQEEVVYLLQPTELFARTYTQFIASVSNDSRVKTEVGQDVSFPLRLRPYPRQWTNDEFEPIAVAFQHLFARLGWTR